MRIAVRLGIVLMLIGSFCAPPASAQQKGDLQQELERLMDLRSKRLVDRASRWRCEPAVKFQCSKEGCEKARLTVWVNLDFPARRYERCDSKGCDAYLMEHRAAGSYTTVSPGIGKGAFLKALNDGREFVEVASLGTAVVTVFGQCTPQ